MPEFTLGSLNAETDWVPFSGDQLTVEVLGGFGGAVRLFYRATPDGIASPIAANTIGAHFVANGASGALTLTAPSMEPEAQIQARMVAHANGSTTVRIGRHA
jgi:hypothetical protein